MFRITGIHLRCFVSIIVQKQRTDYVPKSGLNSLPPAPTPPPPAPALPTAQPLTAAVAAAPLPPVEHHRNSSSSVSRQNSSTSSDNGSISMREQKTYPAAPTNRT